MRGPEQFNAEAVGERRSRTRNNSCSISFRWWCLVLV